MAGVVEEVGSEEKWAFRSRDELWRILNNDDVEDDVPPDDKTMSEKMGL